MTTNHFAIRIVQVKGLAVGSVAHVAGMAALGAAGETLAAEWAAVAFFFLGTYRCLLLQIPPFRDLLGDLCVDNTSDISLQQR